MTQEQIQLVRSSWPIAAASADALTSDFYERLFAIDPSAAALFVGVDMAKQRQRLAQAIAVVVKGADDPDRLLPALTALGRRHAGYGVEAGHFDSVGEALIGALGAILGNAFTPAVCDAWVAAYALVSSVMKQAMSTAAVGTVA